MSALGDPRRNVSYVPYSDSLLTRLLAPSLGGNCLTLLLCCISPLSSHTEETLNSLLFCCRAANIKNSPLPNIVRQEESPGLYAQYQHQPHYDQRRNSTCSSQQNYPAVQTFMSPTNFNYYDPTPVSTSPLSFKSGAAPLDLYLRPQNINLSTAGESEAGTPMLGNHETVNSSASILCCCSNAFMSGT